MHCKLRRLQPRRGTCDVALHYYRSRGLQLHAAAPRLGLKTQLPAPWSNLIHISRDARQRERKLFVRIFEIDAAVVKIDFQ